MLFKESFKKFKVYNAGDIIGLHKYAYYGDLNRFERLITKDLLKQYKESIYYCIDYGCKRNFEFAEYILNNIEFVDIKYKMSITATYIKNGKYDERLYLDKFNYSLYKNISKQSILSLLEYENLHNILYFVCILHSFELPITVVESHPVERLQRMYNLPDSKKSKHLTDFSNFLLSCPKYTKDDLDPYSFSCPPGDYKNICNIERELLKIYLSNDHKESEIISPLNEINIINDARFAIEAYSKNILIDYCLSKFVTISAKLSLDLVKKHKPFLVFTNTCFDFDYLDKYISINPLYRHNFVYNAIMYHHLDVIDFIGEDIDYCYFDACIKSCNYSAFSILKKMNKKCYKRLDYSKNKYIENNDEVKIEYDDIFNRLKFDVSSYIYL